MDKDNWWMSNADNGGHQEAFQIIDFLGPNELISNRADGLRYFRCGQQDMDGRVTRSQVRVLAEPPIPYDYWGNGRIHPIDGPPPLRPVEANTVPPAQGVRRGFPVENIQFGDGLRPGVIGDLVWQEEFERLRKFVKKETKMVEGDPFQMRIIDAYGMARKKGEYGIEIEVEGRNLQAEVRGWSVHNDNSLRNGGVEYVLTNPGSRQKIIKLVQDLKAVLNQEGRKVIPSYRQSTHVHINVQDWTIQKVLDFITVFTVFDPLICYLVGPERDGNLFCLPAHDTGDLHLNIASLASMTKKGQLRSFQPRGKYASLNMGRMHDFGSLEVRVFPMSLEATEIDKYLRWIENIIKFSDVSNPRELRARIEEVWSNPIGLSKQILEDWSTPDEVTRKLLTIGSETAYELYHAVATAKKG